METLSKSFLQFKSNYVMNKLTFSLTELLNELTTYESMMDKHKFGNEANVAESSKSAHKRKRNAGKATAKPKKNKKGSKESKDKGIQRQRKMFPL